MTEEKLSKKVEIVAEQDENKQNEDDLRGGQQSNNRVNLQNEFNQIPSRLSIKTKGIAGQRNSVATDANQLKIQISRLIVKKHIDTRKKGLCPQDLIEIAHDIGLRLSHQQASQAIFFFKGGNPFHNISLNPSNLMDKKLAQGGGARTGGSKSVNEKQAAKKGALMMSPQDRMEIIRKNKNFQKLIEWFLLNIPSLSGIASKVTAQRLQPMTAKPTSNLKQKFNFNQSLLTQINNQQQGSLPPSSARIDDRLKRGKFNQYKKRMQNVPPQFKEKVRHCLSDIHSLPPLKKVLNSTYSTIGSAICDYKASFGNDAQEKAKRRLKQTSKQRQSLIQDNLNNIITSQPDALHATSLYYLLSKRWLQYPNSYKLQTNLGWKDERRIKDLLNSRNL